MQISSADTLQGFVANRIDSLSRRDGAIPWSSEALSASLTGAQLPKHRQRPKCLELFTVSILALLICTRGHRHFKTKSISEKQRAGAGPAA